MPFLPFLPCLILQRVLGSCLSPWCEERRLLGLYCLLLSFCGPGHCLGRSSCSSSSLGFNFCCSFSCHVGPLDLLPLPLGSHGPFTLLLSLIVSMGLLAVILATLAHWIYYPFSWGSKAHLFYFYHLLCPWAYWLSFLPCWPTEFITSLLGFPRPIYFTFISYYAHEPVGCHSCHVGLLGLSPLFLDFQNPFTLFLPLLFSFFSHIFLLLGFFCHCAFCQKYASTKK